MAGIYIHIPFCKQACNYCDFHFSTVQKSKPRLIASLIKEMKIRKNELKGRVETLYFGGGTPSLLKKQDWTVIMESLNVNFDLKKVEEFTIECNPDDLVKVYLHQLKEIGVNRLSVGIQSFFDHHLSWMNRAHNGKEAIQCIDDAQELGFSNISIDLIYGIPGMTLKEWEYNIDTAIELNVQHISAYHLTVETKTQLAYAVKKGDVVPVNDEVSDVQYELLCDKLLKAGFIHYEISNFGKEGFFSRHNSSYWLGKPYLGFGPAAHSFDGEMRKWNVANNAIYCDKIERNELPQTIELLTPFERFNEHLLIGFRTIWGCDLEVLKSFCNLRDFQQLVHRLKKLEQEKLIYFQRNKFFTTEEGKKFADKLASDLFIVNSI
jgi:oxygen-independent coproporphyrinogen III oxidase